MKTPVLIIVAAIFTGLAMSCGHLSMIEGGGGSEVEVVGCVYFPNGDPAAHTQVKLVPRDHNTVTMGAIGDSLIDTSDAQGRYVFRSVAPGWYNVQAVHLAQRTRLLITAINVAPAETTLVQSGVLLEPGAIRLLLAKDLSSIEGYAIIPGTDIAAFPATDGSEAMLDSVPAGRIPEVRFIAAGDTATVARLNVLVNPGDTVTIANPAWKYEQNIVLNTSASGANVKSNVPGFPVLIRLNSAGFDFSQALAGGADLRFTKPDNTFLPYEIERWDPVTRLAEVWVKVDTVHGNDSSQTILMYWGNAAAKGSSSGTVVFDTAEGFQGVWHLGERGNKVALDATVNHYDGMAYGMSGFSPNPGAIGNARAFDGASSYITMPNTAAGKLNFPVDGYYSVSAWVNLNSLDGAAHLIVAKGYEQYFLRFTYFPSNSPLWEFSEFGATDSWKACTTPARSGQWVLLTGVKQGNRQLLYCNGIVADSTPNTYQNSNLLRNTSYDLSIGRFLETITLPNNNEGSCFFKGSIDEVRISSTARSPDWVWLSYMNQRADDKLVEFK